MDIISISINSGFDYLARGSEVLSEFDINFKFNLNYFIETGEKERVLSQLWTRKKGERKNREWKIDFPEYGSDTASQVNFAVVYFQSNSNTAIVSHRIAYRCIYIAWHLNCFILSYLILFNTIFLIPIQSPFHHISQDKPTMPFFFYYSTQPDGFLSFPSGLASAAYES